MGKLCQSKSAFHLHLFVDFWRSCVERPSENEREAHHVVDLVWIVRSTCCENGIWTDFLCLIRCYLWLRVCHSKDNWFLCHLRKVLTLQCTCSRNSNEDVSANKGILESPCISFQREFFFLWVHTCCSTLVDHSSCIAYRDILLLDTVIAHELDASNASCTCSVQHDFGCGWLPPCDLHRTDKSSQANDRSSMLVIVEDRDVHELLEFLFHIEAVRSLDVF